MSATFNSEALRCPISRQIMADPVTAADGFTYEREFIEKWFKDGRSQSPTTNAPLPNLQLIPNHLIKSLIQEQIEKHPEWLDNEEVHLPEALMQSLRKAIEQGDLEETKKLLAKDKRLLTHPLDATTKKKAFHLAMECANVEIPKEILSKLVSPTGLIQGMTEAAPPTAYCPAHRSAVLRACLFRESLRECDALEKLGALANLAYEDPESGCTLLHLVAEKGLVKSCEWLLAKNANLVLKASKSGDLPLHFAIRGGHADVITLLLGTQKSAQLKWENSSKVFPLAELLNPRFFTKEKREELLPLFGVPVRDSKLPALHIALRVSATYPNLYASILRFPPNDLAPLLEEKDTEGSTPLCYAVSASDVNRIKSTISPLLKAKANPRATCGVNEENALHLAVQKRDAAVVSSLLSPDHKHDLGALANSETKAGQTALHLLVETEIKFQRVKVEGLRNNVSPEFNNITKSLIAARAFVDATNNDGLTASQIARNAQRGDLATAIEKGSFDFNEGRLLSQSRTITQLLLKIEEMEKDPKRQKIEV